MSVVERLALKLRHTIEPHNRADYHVADLELFADSTCGAGSNDDLRPHLADDLTPHIYIRKLRAILRHMRIGFEDDDALRSDLGGPIRPQAFELECRAAGPHLPANVYEIVRLRATF